MPYAMHTRFRAGAWIRARRSGHDGDSIAEVLTAEAAGVAGLYRVRWEDGVETYYVPGPDVRDRRTANLGPPPGQPERRRRFRPL